MAGLGSGWPVAVASMVLGRPRRHFEGAGEGAGDGAEALAVAWRGARRSEAVPRWEGLARLGEFRSGRVARQPGSLGCRWLKALAVAILRF